MTEYLNDTQPGLTKVLAQTTGANTDRFMHGPRGIHAQHDGTNWQHMVQDGLGSVRTIIDNTLNVDAVQSYDPIGNPMGSYGAGFGFTGEQTDHTGQIYLRARYYDPGIGTFTALDPFEGMMDRPMSLNGYSWVEGNPVMNTDASGEMLDQLGLVLGNPLNAVSLLNSGACSVYQSSNICVAIDPASNRYYFDCDSVPDLIDPSWPITQIDGNTIPDFVVDSLPGSDTQTDAETDTDTDRLASCKVPPGDNRGTLGVFIHQLIQVFFQYQFGRQHTDVEAPPIEGAAADGSGGSGRPDAVLYPSGNPTSMLSVEIYEIKPISQGPDSTHYEAGKEQLRRYVRNWRYTTGSKRISYAREGQFWNPNGYWMTYPFDTSQELVLYTFYEDAPGMVYYGCRNAGGS